MLKLSPSKIKSFLLCPFKYKCDSDPVISKKYYKDSPALTFGNLVHGTLNDFYKRTPKEQRTLQRLRDLFKEKYKKNEQKHQRIFRTQEKITEYVLKARKMFENFVNSEFCNKDPMVTEEFPRHMLNADLELSGKFDRVDLEEGNKLTIIDYKTGSFEKDEKDPFQLDFYELMLLYTYPNFKVEKKIYYFLEDNKIEEIPIKDNNLLEVERNVIKIADDISNTSEFLPRENAMCIYCNYKGICSIKGT